MPEPYYDILTELAKAKFTPSAVPWSSRKSEIYPKFDYFAKIVSSNVSDPQVLQGLETIRTKLQS